MQLGELPVQRFLLVLPLLVEFGEEPVLGCLRFREASSSSLTAS